ncbi:MAG: hypothetical protein H0V93_14720 [Euzebyales bacterium]|nr:hypothetical protein [Euzebyales bacterium]
MPPQSSPPSRRRLVVRSWPRLAATTLVLPMAVVATVVVVSDPGSAVAVNGPDGALLSSSAVAELRVTVAGDGGGGLGGVRVLLDDVDVTAAAGVGAGGLTRECARACEGDSPNPGGGGAEHRPQMLTWQPGALEDGEHELVVEVPRRFPRRDLVRRWRFEVDNEPPVLALDEPQGPAPLDQPVEITGTVDDESATVTADGTPVEVADGRFTLAYDAPPADPVLIEAVDAAGNAASERVQLPVVASRVEVDVLRSVHVSFHGWAEASLRERILELAEAGLVSSVQLDLKDESGTVGYDTQVPLAEEIGAETPIYDLAAAVEELHGRGVHVVGRIVAFRDPVLAEHAWASGQRDLVIQTPAGDPYAGYGGFTNFAHPEVVAYNVDLAEEAARLGVDDILWDYVRRPDGAVGNLVIDGLAGTPEQAIVDFLAEADARLAPYAVGHGASVYGIAVDRPTEIAQDIPAIAEHVDYVAPMLYPSHWGPGEYGVANPDGQPYDIVLASMRAFVAAVDGRRARIVPWLQDFSLGATYGPDQVAAQIQATADAGVDEWLLWDPAVTYTRAALER